MTLFNSFIELEMMMYFIYNYTNYVRDRIQEVRYTSISYPLIMTKHNNKINYYTSLKKINREFIIISSFYPHQVQESKRIYTCVHLT